LEAYSYALSEPLFIVAIFLSLIALAGYLNGRRLSCLFAAAGCAALAGMTRYVGMILVPVGCLLILSRSSQNWIKRARDASFFAIIALLPNALWFVRNARVG